MDAFRFKNDEVGAALIEYRRIGGRPPNYPSHWLWCVVIGILMMVIGIVIVVIGILHIQSDLWSMVTNWWAAISRSTTYDLWYRVYWFMVYSFCFMLAYRSLAWRGWFASR
jgi:hypothetical protein